MPGDRTPMGVLVGCDGLETPDGCGRGKGTGSLQVVAPSTAWVAAEGAVKNGMF